MADTSFEYFPIRRTVSKYFLTPFKSAEREYVDALIKGKSGLSFMLFSRYSKLRTARADWMDPGYACFPEGLDRFPPYWAMPWQIKVRLPLTCLIRFKLWFRFFIHDRQYKSSNINQFKNMLSSILKDGFKPDDKDPIVGHCLVHPRFGEVFVYTDGNRRLGILSYLSEQNNDADFKVPVLIMGKIHRDHVEQHPAAVEGVRKGYFSQGDVLRWFDHPFHVLGLDRTT
jgi:hypothetical protein